MKNICQDNLTNHGIQETGKRVIVQSQLLGGNNTFMKKYKKKKF